MHLLDTPLMHLPNKKMTMDNDWLKLSYISHIFDTKSKLEITESRIDIHQEAIPPEPPAYALVVIQYRSVLLYWGYSTRCYG